MSYLILGVVLWSVVHLVPAVAPEWRTGMAAKMGEYGFKSLFALLISLSVGVMIFGWKATPDSAWFDPPSWAVHVAFIGSLAMFLTFFAPYVECNLRRIFRHPQLLGVVFWGLGHLLANGEGRSVVLFGGLTLWALAEVVLINRRDRDWERPAAVSMKGDFKLLLTGLGFFLVFLFTHERLFGVSALPA